MIRIAFDIGGTFTDFVLQDDRSGVTRSFKIPSTPSEPSAAVLAGLDQLFAGNEIDVADVATILHATTVATNAVLERKGAPTGLITTEGFRDILIIGRQKRYETYDLYLNKPQPLVQRRHIVEVEERIDHDGSVATPINTASIDRAIDRMLASGREAVAVSLLHAYANDAHERAIHDRLRARAPQLEVSLSSEIAPKFREYERTSTAVANAYVKPVVTRYIARLDHALKSRGLGAELFIMQSNGGLISADIASDFPIRIIESGPAAGVLMAGMVAKQEGADRVISFDMGGTTAKLGAVDDAVPAVTSSFEVGHVNFRRGSGLPINVPSVELLEIGAGGGSIARLQMNMIAVGPDSAGAAPGPIAYRLGGDRPTVTDANVVLGYISPDRFNAGSLHLDAEAAGAGIVRDIAEPLGIGRAEAAWGIHLIATNNMENALRIISVERGRDPREHVMVAFGGAGPLHAARMARSIGLPRVIVPGGAGVGSALGLLAASPRIDVSLTRVMQIGPGSTAAVADIFHVLETRALEVLRRLDAPETPAWSRSATMRYVGQGFEIHVELPPGPIDDSYTGGVIAAFERTYLQLRKFLDPEAGIEAVDWTLTATLPTGQRIGAPAHHESTGARQQENARPAWFPETRKFNETPVHSRAGLATGQAVPGPAIIEDPDCTIVVPPGDVAWLSESGNLIIDIGG